MKFELSTENFCQILALGEDMYKDGYKNITNIDYSKTVIDNMKERCGDTPGMTCKYIIEINDQKKGNRRTDTDNFFLFRARNGYQGFEVWQ